MVQGRLLLVLIVTFGLNKPMVEGKRGPHHPRSEILGKDGATGGAIDNHLIHDDEHLKADLSAAKVRMEKPLEEMTSEEKQFYHFKMHDYDNNNLLDGLEILQSANIHDATFHKKLADDTNRGQPTATNDGHDHGEEGEEGASPGDKNSVDGDGGGHSERDLEHLVDIIDDFLLYADKNNDGFLNFNEYKDSLRATPAAHDDQGAAGDGGDYHPTDSSHHHHHDNDDIEDNEVHGMNTNNNFNN